MKGEPKVYFFDCAAAFDESGPRLENTVACALLKFCHLGYDRTGRKLGLHYFRDREGREVDFVVTEGRRALWCVEVKTDDTGLHRPLRYLCERLQPTLGGIQLVSRLTERREVDGIKILPLAEWIEKLPAHGARGVSARR
jgi:hypothetical protein